jgi:hypothetical protein
MISYIHRLVAIILFAEGDVRFLSSRLSFSHMKKNELLSQGFYSHYITWHYGRKKRGLIATLINSSKGDSPCSPLHSPLRMNYPSKG